MVLQKPSSFQKWHDATPDDFVFSVKASRYITHIKRLKECEEGLANFLASGPLALREKLGPILWQFPPNFKFDRDLLAKFFELLPKNTYGVADLAKRHATLPKDRLFIDSEINKPLHHVIEIRNRSFETHHFIDLLLEYGITLVFADTVEWPYLENVTGNVIYARLHGSEELYVSGYSEEALDHWAARLRLWAQGLEPNDAKRIEAAFAQRHPRDVFIYFDNDVKVRAPFNAMSLAKRLSD